MKKTKLKSLDVDVVKFILFNNKVSIEELSNCFDVSQANIRNILSRIEMFVSENNLGILLKDNNEYFFKDNYLNLNFDYTEFSTDRGVRTIFWTIFFILIQDFVYTPLDF